MNDTQLAMQIGAISQSSLLKVKKFRFFSSGGSGDELGRLLFVAARSRFMSHNIPNRHHKQINPVSSERMKGISNRGAAQSHVVCHFLCCFRSFCALARRSIKSLSYP
jgi:hypothetical protein